MRVPQYERRRFRIRGWMIAAVVIALVLLFSLRSLAGFYTDYLWFDSLGQGNTWGRLLSAKVVPALVFTVAFFLIMLVNLVIADRLAPRLRMGPLTPEDEMVARYRSATERYTGRIRVAVSVFFALIAGLGVSSQWKEWMLFTHRVDFHRTDPQFHKDIGFYVFQLPFIRFIIDWLFAGLVIVLLVTAVAYYLNGGIRFQSATQRVSPHVKAHLSVILAAMALVKTAEYFFGRFELNFSTGGAVDGAGYTQVKAELPALNLLIFISIVAAALFLWNIWRRGWVLPIIAVGLWGFVSIVVGTIYPADGAAIPGEAERVREGAALHRPKYPGNARRVQPVGRQGDELPVRRVAHRGRGLEQQDHDRQRAPVGPRRDRGHVRPGPGAADLLQRRRRRRRPVHGRQRDPADLDLVARGQRQRAARRSRGSTSTSCTHTGTA